MARPAIVVLQTVLLYACASVPTPNPGVKFVARRNIAAFLREKIEVAQ